MKLAIVIVSYNGKRWLKATLMSCTQFAKKVPVYVVDNASTDGSADYIAQEFSDAHLIREIKNTGFAGGNNIGIQAALAAGAEAIFLLNQDAELTNDCLEKLSKYLLNNPRVAAVQPAIFLPDGRVNSLGNGYHFLGFGFAGGNGLTLKQAYQQVPWARAGTEPPYVSGAAVLLRASALRQVGVFDEALFLYHEDLEVSLRLRLAEWSLAVVDTARVIHHYDSKRSNQQFYFMERNRWLVWLLYFKLPTLIILSVIWLPMEVLLLLLGLVGGWLPAKIKSYAYFFTFRPWLYIRERRRVLQKLRTCTDRHLLSYATARIQFQTTNSWLVEYVLNPVSALAWKIIYLFVWF